MSLPDELASLPTPDAIEVLSYETRLEELVDKLVEEMAAAGIPYDVEPLETDPAVILVEVATYADINLRQRINEAVRANLLPYATGADLAILAAFYGVTRMYLESDDRLRTRVVLEIQGRSTGGTAPRYKAKAMEADVSVADAVVYTIGRDPTVYVAVFVEGGEPAEQSLLDKVDAALQDPAVRMVNDVIVVEAAIGQIVDVTANVWLVPSASASLIDEIAANLATAWADEVTLGHDITRSWLAAKLHLAGVHNVEILAPAGDVVIAFNKAPALGAVTLNYAGRGF